MGSFQGGSQGKGILQQALRAGRDAEDRRDLVRGDHLITRRRNAEYTEVQHGIYDGFGWVFLYAAGSGSASAVRMVPLSEFAEGGIEEVRRAPHRYASASSDRVVARAWSRMTEEHDHPVFENGEQFANWCVGEARS